MPEHTSENEPRVHDHTWDSGTFQMYDPDNLESWISTDDPLNVEDWA